jgi:hypothetical protein
MGIKAKEHRKSLEARNNRMKAIEKRYRQIYGVKSGEIVSFKRSKANGFENKPMTSKNSTLIGERKTIYNWGILFDLYQKSEESKKGGFGMGRVTSVSEERGIRTVNLLTMDKKWKISIEEKYVRRLEEEEDSLVSALDDIGQI